MLRADKPTHPEYLAMMQCVDQRLEDKLRHIRREHDYRMEALDRWAVSRRAQVLSQFYQSVRESREDLLENLGRQWYEIQHERRRHANTIPDYGIRFPQAKTQRIKDAIAYNKEVSILSGIAKYRGFPAAPDVNGASGEEVDDDMEAIAVSVARSGLLRKLGVIADIYFFLRGQNKPPAHRSTIPLSKSTAACRLAGASVPRASSS